MTFAISSVIQKSIEVKQLIYNSETIIASIQGIVETVTDAFRCDKKVLFCGNGGSAADAQHLAAELTGKFNFDRKPLFAEALHVNSSYLTAVANDYSYDEVFSRLIEAKGKPGDILIALSTSGKSKNILHAIDTANQIGLITIGLSGATCEEMEHLCKHTIKVPSHDTARIQECHIMIGHIICQAVERNLFAKKKPAVFLDRDGVINKKMAENDYVKNPEEFIFLPESFQALKSLKEKGFLVIIVTNQRCIARGIIDENQLNDIHKEMNEKIESNGGYIDAIYICPHDITDHCICRKPETGLFLQAIEDFGHKGIEIDIGRSFMIGDSEKDIAAGKATGLKTIMVGNDPLPGTPSAKNLFEAVKGIVFEQNAFTEKGQTLWRLKR